LKGGVRGQDKQIGRRFDIRVLGGLGDRINMAKVHQRMRPTGTEKVDFGSFLNQRHNHTQILKKDRN